MKGYPEVITPHVLEINAHITDEEIATDIADTEREIDGYRRTLVAEQEVARNHPSPIERKMADFRSSARPGQIEERERFVAFLRRLQAARAEAVASAELDSASGEGARTVNRTHTLGDRPADVDSDRKCSGQLQPSDSEQSLRRRVSDSVETA
jgi:hypothetical protein